ncbi:transglutaminase [Flavobacterium branchiophilum]|uniref:Transglutaminase n=1 Tax=Flavobacterium branchiophilum TaxID=55197 RepID=A0A543G7T8_9FLAO|nr:transglutaminase [Flavobacterium branchiophilum]OXA72639.1 transglutaminase [Flavobacterium branchiophilum] [Flavobacterium branchiophilum NBRC 15030 = ATCC 35035]TQM42150.1 hypothetical protein BC670_3184 [Flavobacterium branchiophilum]GEM53922.1 transglutaminase [Flavobacterium branchiophilum NBRC 15030 = ATCC 35035]
MNLSTQDKYNQIINQLKVPKPWDNIIIFLLNILIAIPVFIIVHQNTISFEGYYNLDRILLFILILVVFQLILRAMRKITFISIFFYIIALIYGTLFGSYGFESVYEDYQSILYSMNENPYPQDIIIEKLLPFPNKNKIIAAVEFENPKVRNFAMKAINKNFKNIKGYSKYRTTIQSFAVFKEINSQWQYVSDPKGHDYIAKASESLLYFSGDCDDYSVLMAASIKSIGAIPRIIHTGGHVYPEILIGNNIDLENINYLIKKILFNSESFDKKIHFHKDERGQIWVNLDYTAKHPGGPFLHEEILGALTLE